MAMTLQKNEIRVFVRGGVIQSIGLGSALPPKMRITVADADSDGCDPSLLEDDGYGSGCILSDWTPKANLKRDKDGVGWL